MTVGSFERLMGGEVAREKYKEKGMSDSWVGGRRLTQQEADVRYGKQYGDKAIEAILADRARAQRAGFNDIRDYKADIRKDPYEVVNSLVLMPNQYKRDPSLPKPVTKPVTPNPPSVTATAKPVATSTPTANPWDGLKGMDFYYAKFGTPEQQTKWNNLQDKLGQPRIPTKANPTQPAPQQPTPVQPAPQQPVQQAQPSYNYTPTPFSAPQYNQLSYNDALKQAQGQLDPIYQRAVQDIMSQRFSNEQAAGEQAAARGLGHSGLAADAQNKLAIAAQNQIGNAGLQRASQSAQMAQALVDSDFQRAMQLRNQALQEYMGQNGVGLDAARFNYGQYRDTQGDAFRDKQFDWQKYMGNQDIDYRNRQFDWQRSTDQRDFDFNKWLQEAMLTGRVYV